MSEPLRALTLVSYENDKMILHEDVLKKVLESPEAKNRPVAVISIAGKLRKGKSFFLNFVLRYLKAKRDANWISTENGPLIGFEWKPTKNAVTSGITIWPEVFVINNVAVVLLDTQGLFDRNKSTKEDTFIMVTSSLFSSFHVLNYQENLDSLDLKNFEYFLQYGMALESATKNLKGFQNLLFLIRDWMYGDEFSYGLEKGEEHMEDFTKKELNAELSSIPTSLKKHFEKVECFLMPYPGVEVARNQQFVGDINKIERKFLENIKSLVEHLIANVKPKKVLGKEENGKHLLQVMKNYVEILNSGVLPEPKSLIQLQLDVLQKNAENECMEIYNDNMREGTKKLLNKFEMEALHKECAAAALQVFDNLPDFGNQEQIKAAKPKSFKQLEGIEFAHYKTTMEERVESKLQEILQQAMENHRGSLERATQTLSNLSNLENVIAVCRNNALDHYNNNTQFGDPDRNLELIAKLIKEMNEKDGFCRVAMKKRIEEHYNEVLSNCKIQYKKLMETEMMTLDLKDYVAVWTDPVQQMHNRCTANTIRDFNLKSQVDESSLLNQFRTELIEFMNKEHISYQAVFKKNRSDMTTTALGSAAVTGAARGFMSLMEVLGENAENL